MLQSESGISSKTYELCFEKTDPPRVIDFFSSEEKPANAIFQQEYLYVMVDCSDHKLINDLKINVRVSNVTDKRREKEKLMQ